MSSEEFSELSDYGQNDEIDIPDDPGPAITGNTPVIGSLRRSNDLPVVRDEIGEELEEMF